MPLVPMPSGTKLQQSGKLVCQLVGKEGEGHPKDEEKEKVRETPFNYTLAKEILGMTPPNNLALTG
jgi:hypothetical protein